MTQPATVQCKACGEEVFEHNLATAVRWEVQNGALIGKGVRQLPYCGRCQRRACGAYEGVQAHKERLVGLYERMLRDEHNPEDGERKCNRCKLWKPTSLFRYHQLREADGGKVYRRGTCYSCFTLGVGRSDTQVKPKSGTAYDIARKRIEARSGKKIQEWPQRLHEIHCLLMRELCHIPQHMRLDEYRAEQESPNPPSHSKEIRLWSERSQRVQHWLNGSSSSINGVMASSSALT